VVDDDEVARMLIRGALEHEGFAVEEGSNGREAITAFLDGRPDAVILDVVMPVMDGFETCAALRRIPAGADVPILMLTGKDDVDYVRQAFDLGATDFATKPINWLLLAHRVNYMVRSAKLLTDLRRSEARRGLAERSARLGHWEWDVAVGKFHWSEEIHRIMGTSPDTFVPTAEAALQLVPAEDRERVRKEIEEPLRRGETAEVEYRIERPDGTRWIRTLAEMIVSEDGRPLLIAGTMHDVTEEREALARAPLLEHFDPLTGLPNRTLLRDWLAGAHALAVAKGRPIALFLLQLDGIQKICEASGVATGDQLLRLMVNRLTAVMGCEPASLPEDVLARPRIVSRIGGLEFLLAAVDFDVAEAERIAQELRNAMAAPLVCAGREVALSGSLGSSFHPDGGNGPSALLRSADEALALARRAAGRAP
jgi:diguanylate cyclase (GGDEF)-like protein/PAS domain S-box-containing protein